MNLICNGCHGKINTKKERYVHVEDWTKDNITADSWWHLKCFKKAMNRDLTELEKKASKMLKKAETIYGNLPEEYTQEVFRI